jgi:hypothetical protein
MAKVPDRSTLSQLMRKGHKIRAMLDDDPDNAQIELFYALQYFLFDHDPPDDDDQEDDDLSEAGGP